MDRQRLGVARCGTCSTKSFALAQPETPGEFYGGLRLMELDGTIFDVLDSEANAAVFARPSAGPRGEALSLRSASSAWWSWGHMSETPRRGGPPPMPSKRWSPVSFRHLTSEMLLLWDRGFFS